MMESLAHAVIVIILLFGGYLASVFANAIYITPDELRELFPQVSSGRRRKLERFIANPRAFFQVAFLIRITGAILLGMVALKASQRLVEFGLRPAGLVYGVICLAIWAMTLYSYVHLPRRISHDRVKRRLVRFLPVISLIYVGFSPFIHLFSVLLRRRPAPEVTEEQKDDIVERAIETLAESAGIAAPLIEQDEKEMIHQIFQLDVTEVQEIMVPRVNVVGISDNASLEVLQKIVDTHGYSRYPVFHETIDHVVGLLKVKDLILLTDDQRKSFQLADHVREALRVGEHKKIDQLLAEFKKTKTHMAIVMDEFGGTAGVVTLEDILEEIFGEIQDEHDDDEEIPIRRIDGGRLEVSGECPLEDLAEELGLELEEGEFQTVGGMIYDMVGSVPVEGTALAWKNNRLKVLRVEGQRIKKVMVLPLS